MTRRAVRCRTCGEPTGDWFDTDLTGPPDAQCGGCNLPGVSTAQRPPTADVPPLTDEPDYFACSECGGHEFSCREVHSTWLDTRDDMIAPGDTVFFDSAGFEYADTLGAECVNCGHELPRGTWDVG